MNIYCFDASASIPTSTPDGCHAVLGYLNSKEAADPWTLDDWLRFSHLRQFPAWVAELYDGAPSAREQAATATAQAKALGWHEGRAIVADMEATDDPVWWSDWSRTVRRLGYVPVWYGSRSVQPSAAEADWRWLAEPDGNPVIPDGYQAKQFKWGLSDAGGVIDLSVISGDLHRHGGEGPRHAPGTSAARALIERILPHETTTTTTTTNGDTVSVAEKIKTFIDSHAAELETLLADVAPVAEAVIPGPVAEAVNVLTKFLAPHEAAPADPTLPASPVTTADPASAGTPESADSSVTAGSTLTA